MFSRSASFGVSSRDAVGTDFFGASDAYGRICRDRYETDLVWLPAGNAIDLAALDFTGEPVVQDRVTDGDVRPDAVDDVLEDFRRSGAAAEANDSSGNAIAINANRLDDADLIAGVVVHQDSATGQKPGQVDRLRAMVQDLVAEPAFDRVFRAEGQLDSARVGVDNQGAMPVGLQAEGPGRRLLPKVFKLPDLLRRWLWGLHRCLLPLRGLLWEGVRRLRGPSSRGLGVPPGFLSRPRPGRSPVLG